MISRSIKRLRGRLLLILAVPLLPVLVVGVAALYNISAPDPADPADSYLHAHPPSNWETGMALKIVTFNIQNTWVVGHHRAERMRAIARKLEDIDPHLVTFQEALVDNDRELLIRELRDSRLRYHHYFHSRRWGSGLLVMSAWPIRETWFHRFNHTGDWFKFWEGDWWAGKGVGLARIELPGGRFLDFYTTHTQAGYDNPRYPTVRLNQMNELAAFMNETRTGSVPAVLAGDMNCRIGREDYNTAVEGANLMRMMNIWSKVDHIFAVHDEHYTMETTETARIEERIQIGEDWSDLSDHPGFFSIIQIQPKEMAR